MNNTMQRTTITHSSDIPLSDHGLIAPNKYRLTRPGAYAVGTPGHTKPTARQGYYLSAYTVQEAADKLRKHGAEGVQFSGTGVHAAEKFDVQLWDDGPQHGLAIAFGV